MTGGREQQPLLPHKTSRPSLDSAFLSNAQPSAKAGTLPPSTLPSRSSEASQVQQPTKNKRREFPGDQTLPWGSSPSGAAPIPSGTSPTGASNPEVRDPRWHVEEPCLGAGDKQPAPCSPSGPSKLGNKAASFHQQDHAQPALGGNESAGVGGNEVGGTDAAAGPAAGPVEGRADGSDDNETVHAGDPSEIRPFQQHTRLDKLGAATKLAAHSVHTHARCQQHHTQQQMPSSPHHGGPQIAPHSNSGAPAEQQQAASPAQSPSPGQQHRFALSTQGTGVLQDSAQHGTVLPVGRLRQQLPNEGSEGQEPRHQAHLTDTVSNEAQAAHTSLHADTNKEHGHDQPDAYWHHSHGFVGKKLSASAAQAAASTPLVDNGPADVDQPDAGCHPNLGNRGQEVQNNTDPSTQQRSPPVGKSKLAGRQVARVADWQQNGPALTHLHQQMSHSSTDQGLPEVRWPMRRQDPSTELRNHGDHSQAQLHRQQVDPITRDLQLLHDQVGAAMASSQQAASPSQQHTDRIRGVHRDTCHPGQEAVLASPQPLVAAISPVTKPAAPLEHLLPQLKAYMEAQDGAGAWSGTFNLPAHVSGDGLLHLSSSINK